MTSKIVSKPHSHSIPSNSDHTVSVKPTQTLYVHLIPKALDLLTHLPPTFQDLQSRTSETPLLSIRLCLLYLVCTRQLTQAQGDQLSPLFKILGTEGIESRLLNLFEKTDLIPLKEHLLAMIFHSSEGLELFESLSDEERVELCGPWMRPMIHLAQTQSFPRYALCALYTSTPKQCQLHLLEKMESFRSEIGHSADLVYEILIKQGLSPLHTAPFLKQIQKHGDLHQLSSLLDESPREVRYFYSKFQKKVQDSIE